MNIFRIAVAPGFLCLLCVAAASQTPPLPIGAHLPHAKERNPELKRALKALQHSREDLMKASRDYGGHRTKAVQEIDAAIDEIKQALAFVQ